MFKKRPNCRIKLYCTSFSRLVFHDSVAFYYRDRSDLEVHVHYLQSAPQRPISLMRNKHNALFAVCQTLKRTYALHKAFDSCQIFGLSCNELVYTRYCPWYPYGVADEIESADHAVYNQV